MLAIHLRFRSTPALNRSARIALFLTLLLTVALAQAGGIQDLLGLGTANANRSTQIAKTTAGQWRLMQPAGGKVSSR